MSDRDELINSYDELPISEKRRELGREIAEMTVITQKLLNDLAPNYSVKPMEEFENLFEENTSEDKYLTGLYEDIIELKETIGDYCTFATSIYYDDKESSNYNNNDDYAMAGFTKIGIIAILTSLVAIGIIILGILIS